MSREEGEKYFEITKPKHGERREVGKFGRKREKRKGRTKEGWNFPRTSQRGNRSLT